jgi:hypothetical protein
MQDIQLLELSAEDFRCQVRHFQCLGFLVELTVSIENGAHGTKKLLLKPQVSIDFA